MRVHGGVCCMASVAYLSLLIICWLTSPPPLNKMSSLWALISPQTTLNHCCLPQTHTHIHTHTHTHTYTHTHIHTRIHTKMHTYTQIFKLTYTHALTYNLVETPYIGRAH